MVSPDGVRQSLIPTTTKRKKGDARRVDVPQAGDRSRRDDAPRGKPLGVGSERARSAALECGSRARMGSDRAGCGAVPRSRKSGQGGRGARTRSSRGAAARSVSHSVRPNPGRVAQTLRSAIVPIGDDEPERHPAAKRLIDAFEDARREVRAGERQAAWMIAWQGEQRTQPEIRSGSVRPPTRSPADTPATWMRSRPIHDRKHARSQPRQDGSERSGHSGSSACAKRAKWKRSKAAEQRRKSTIG